MVNRLARNSAKWWQRNAFDRILFTTYRGACDPDGDVRLSDMLIAFVDNSLKGNNAPLIKFSNKNIRFVLSLSNAYG